MAYNITDETSPKEKKIEKYIKKHLVNIKVFFDYESIKADSYILKNLTRFSQLYFYDDIIKKSLNGNLFFVIGKDGLRMFFLDTNTLLPLSDFSFTDYYYQNEPAELWPFVCVKIEEKWGVYDLETQKLCIPPVFDVIEFIHKTYDYFVVIKDGKYGLCDRNGYLILDMDFDHIKIVRKNTLKITKDGYVFYFDINQERITKTIELYDNIVQMSTKTKNHIIDLRKIISVPSVNDYILYQKEEYKSETIGRSAFDKLNKPFIADTDKIKINDIYFKNRGRMHKAPFPNFDSFREGDIIYISSDINNLFASDCWESVEGGVFAIKRNGDSISKCTFRFLLLYAVRHEYVEINGEIVATGKTVAPKTFFEHDLYDTISSFNTGQEIWEYLKGKTLRVCDVIYFNRGCLKINGKYKSIKITTTPVFELLNEDADEMYGLFNGDYRIISNRNGKYGISLRTSNEIVVNCFFDKIEWNNEWVYFYKDKKMSIMNVSDIIFL